MQFADDILARLESVGDLPTLPSIFTRVSALLNDENSSAADVGQVIRDDPPLTAKILRVANSAVFGGRDEIFSVSLAVARLGYEQTAHIALSLGLTVGWVSTTCRP